MELVEIPNNTKLWMREILHKFSKYQFSKIQFRFCIENMRTKKKKEKKMITASANDDYFLSFTLPAIDVGLFGERYLSSHTHTLCTSAFKFETMHV